MNHYHKETPLLNFGHPDIIHLVKKQGWCALTEYDRIGAIYNYVRDEIYLGYNESDNLSASSVLRDGYGQCNTKTILLMALLRKCGIACRLHGATVHKRLQKGIVTGIVYLLAPREIIHSWVEVFHSNHWISLEGFILDKKYLKSLQQRFPDSGDTFCGYAVATSLFKSPPVNWFGSDTAIQKDAIVRDLGVFDAPDDFFAHHGTNLSGFKDVLYRNVFRFRMNRKVTEIRNTTKNLTDFVHRSDQDIAE